MKKSFSESILVQHVTENAKPTMTSFLKNIVESINRNSQRNPHGKRYDHELKLFCAHLYVVSGLMSYEILYKNISNLPSPSTLNRLIGEESHVREGEINLTGILRYFETKKLPKVVWVSEDQTKIVERVRYTLEGLVSPLDDNGLPLLGFNLAETAFDIKILYPL